MYKAAGKALPGRVAAKLHSGEAGNQNYLHPQFWKPVIDCVGGTVVECKTAYPGERNSTEKHRRLLSDHEWTKFFDVDLMDAEGPDLVVKIPNGRILKENHLGKDIAKYDSRFKLLRGKFPSTASKNEGLTTYYNQPVDLYDEGHLHYFTFRSLSLLLTERCGFSKVEKLGYDCGGRIPLGKTIHNQLALLKPELFSELAIIAYA